ncbi:hypothetical protein GGR57DRAFT_460645 [Xylariaceae sp. FL1272]|nr:hypothetical protein GGR57DRAFT_460645 [Xylariaceae sp. FL1272]
MPPLIRYLRELFWRGIHSGLRFETPPTFTIDDDGRIVRIYVFILRFDHAGAIARGLVMATDSRNKRAIGHFLADAYNYAAEKVEWCAELGPCQFFAEAKASRNWGEKLDDELFWTLTRRLLHARALYLATFPERKVVSQRNELAHALDTFKDAFEATFPLDYLVDLGPRATQLQMEQVEDTRYYYRELHQAYFGLSTANQTGDPDNHVVTETVTSEAAGVDPFVAELEQDQPVPAEMDQPWGWMIDLGPRHERYGHKNEEQKIQDALDQQDAEEAENQAQPAANDSDNEDVAMEMSDDDMDIDLGPWSIS